MADPELPLNDAESPPVEESSSQSATAPMTPTGGKSVENIDANKGRVEPAASQATTGDNRSISGSRSQSGGRSSKQKPASRNTTRDGRDLERRVGRIEFADGAFVRLRAPVRINAESGRDILTDIDVLSIDVDGRLRTSHSILECKSGSGQAKEPDRLLWLAGLQKYLSFDRAVLVRQSVSRRGRAVARALGLQILDIARLGARETAHAWLPDAFAHIDGPECTTAESRTDTQLKGLGHIPADLVAFLRHDALRSDAPDVLRAIAALGRVTNHGGILPSPTREVLAGHATLALLFAAIGDAARLDELSLEELQERTDRALTTGSPDSTQILNVLARADDLVAYTLRRVHAAYEEAGAKRVQVDNPSLREVVIRPPEWVPRYLDLTQKLRANPAVSREILQSAELACFEALLGGQAHLADAFDHLFTAEHRYLLNVAIRCLEAIAGPTTADAVRPILQLDFDRVLAHPNRTDIGFAPRQQAERAEMTIDPNTQPRKG